MTADQKRHGGRPKGTPKSGGRKRGTPNKVTADVRAVAQVHTIDAIGVLARIMADCEQPGAARVSAASALLDRGHGKPGQPITGGDGGPIETLSSSRIDVAHLTLDQIRALASIKISADR